MKLVVHPKYNRFNDWVNEIPSFFSAQGKTIFKARNEIKIFDTDFGKVVVKSFQVPHIINRFTYSFLRSSKAERSYTYSLEIQKRGFGTPHPIAYIELYKMGLLHKSYYVSTYTDYILLRNLNQNKNLLGEEIDILKAFARFTAQLHEKEIYHPDYSDRNILYKKEGENILFHLVDVNRVKFKKVTNNMAYKTFHRLDFSIEMLEIVAREYALKRRLDVGKINKLHHTNFSFKNLPV